MIIFKTLFVTLSKNNNSFTITDESISNNSIFEVYPSDDSVILSDVTVNGTTATIQFDSDAAYNIPCAVFINNLVGAYDTESGIPSPIGQNGNFLTVDNNTTIWKQITTLDVIDLEGTNLNEIINDVNRELTNTYQETQYNKNNIDSLDARVTALEDMPVGVIYTNNETKIGSYLGHDLYRNVIEITPTGSTYFPTTSLIPVFDKSPTAGFRRYINLVNVTCYRESDNRPFMLPSVDNSRSQSNIDIIAQGTNVCVRIGNDYPNTINFIVVVAEYTKD